MSDERENYLTWSKTVNDVAFRLFVLTGGCGNPECSECGGPDDAEPVWALFMLPRALKDEWVLCLVGLGPSEHMEEGMERAIALEDLTATTSQTWWEKAAALYGVPWRVLIEKTWNVCVEQKLALDDLVDPHTVIRQLFDGAKADELREIRAKHRGGDHAEVGEAFGELWMKALIRQSKRGH